MRLLYDALTRQPHRISIRIASVGVTHPMTDNTITRAQLAEAVYSEVGLSRNDSAQLVDVILDEISQALIKDEMVKLSSFGSFQVRAKGKRIGRNPKTGEEVPI